MGGEGRGEGAGEEILAPNSSLLGRLLEGGLMGREAGEGRRGEEEGEGEKKESGLNCREGDKVCVACGEVVKESAGGSGVRGC